MSFFFSSFSVCACAQLIIVCTLAVVLCRGSGVRPFGVSLLMAGCDDEGPHLYQVDPSGSYFAWKASAIGKHTQSAKDVLEKRCACVSIVYI